MKRKFFVVLLFLSTTFVMADPLFAEIPRTDQNTSPSIEANNLENVLGIPSATPRGPQDIVREYEEGMQSITQQFATKLVTIANAVQRGDLTAEQGESLSAEEYQSAQMQFDLLSALREILQQDIARAATVARPPALEKTEQNEIVMAALPFSSLQLSSSIIEYLDLSAAQVGSIDKLLSDERRDLEPLMAKMQETRDRLLNVSDAGERKDNKEVKALAAVQARNLTKLILANSQMRTRIYQLLSPTQQKKLDEFQRQ